MSDVNIAPPAPPAVPAAPANEAPINPSPVSSPQPIGSQAPPTPVGDVKGSEHRPETRREAIQRAFDKARDGDKAPKKVEAKRGMGDNNPPEKMEREKPKLDLRKRPEQPREGGRFAKAPEAAQDAQAPAVQAKAQQPGQQPAAPRKAVNPLPEGAPFRDPPQRMAEHAKAEWAAAPESVRGEVQRMHHEFAEAFKRYRGDNEVMNTIRPYHELATQHGTTLDRALNNYVSMEQKLRSDVVGGLDVIVNNLNLRTPEGRKLGLRDVAYHILQQSPDQQRIVQNSNAQSALSQQIGQLHQVVSSLAQNQQQMQTERVFHQTRSQVDQFADNHPRFDELGDLIEQELRYGFDLDTAYRRAELLRPTTHAAQTRNPPAQTRQTKSIHGAPEAPGLSDRQPRRATDKPIGRREAIASAIRRVNGAV